MFSSGLVEHLSTLDCEKISSSVIGFKASPPREGRGTELCFLQNSVPL